MLDLTYAKSISLRRKKRNEICATLILASGNYYSISFSVTARMRCDAEQRDVHSTTSIRTKLNRACKSRRRILHLRVNILSFVRSEYIKRKNLASGSSIKVRPFNSIITRVLRTSDSTFITFYPRQQIYMEFAILSWQVTRFIRDISFITLALIILKISSAISLSLSLSRTTYRYQFIMLICREKTWLFPCFRYKNNKL